MGLEWRMLGAGRWDERDRAAGAWPVSRSCRCRLWLQAQRGRGLAAEPGELRHAVGQISEAAIRRCPDDADGAHGQCHRLFLLDKDMFDGRARGGFACIGLPCPRRRRPPRRLLAVDA